MKNDAFSIPQSDFYLVHYHQAILYFYKLQERMNVQICLVLYNLSTIHYSYGKSSFASIYNSIHLLHINLVSKISF